MISSYDTIEKVYNCKFIGDVWSLYVGCNIDIASVNWAQTRCELHFQWIARRRGCLKGSSAVFRLQKGAWPCMPSLWSIFAGWRLRTDDLTPANSVSRPKKVCRRTQRTCWSLVANATYRSNVSFYTVRHWLPSSGELSGDFHKQD